MRPALPKNKNRRHVSGQSKEMSARPPASGIFIAPATRFSPYIQPNTAWLDRTTLRPEQLLTPQNRPTLEARLRDSLRRQYPPATFGTLIAQCARLDDYFFRAHTEEERVALLKTFRVVRRSTRYATNIANEFEVLARRLATGAPTSPAEQDAQVRAISGNINHLLEVLQAMFYDMTARIHSRRAQYVARLDIPERGHSRRENLNAVMEVSSVDLNWQAQEVVGMGARIVAEMWRVFDRALNVALMPAAEDFFADGRIVEGAPSWTPSAGCCRRRRSCRWNFCCGWVHAAPAISPRSWAKQMLRRVARAAQLKSRTVQQFALPSAARGATVRRGSGGGGRRIKSAASNRRIRSAGHGARATPPRQLSAPARLSLTRVAAAAPTKKRKHPSRGHSGASARSRRSNRMNVDALERARPSRSRGERRASMERPSTRDRRARPRDE